MKIKSGAHELKEAITHVTILAVIIIAVIYFSPYLELMGLILIAMSLLPLISLKLTGEKIKESISEMVFGAFNTGLIALLALGGFALQGVFGAIVGVIAGDAITEGF